MTTRLTPAQVAQAARSAGFTGQALVNAVAVALAESGGNPTAVNVNRDKYRSRDRGLWQINDHYHPEVSDAAAFNPTSAAAAAYRISGGGRSFSAWSTWKNGAAAAQLGTARLGVGSAATAPAVSSSTGATTADPAVFNPLPWAGGLLGHLLTDGSSNPLTIYKSMAVLGIKSAAWVADSHNWTRVLMVAGGGVGVLIGLSMIGKSGAAGSTAATVTAIPGRAAHTATKAAAAVALA